MQVQKVTVFPSNCPFGLPVFKLKCITGKEFAKADSYFGHITQMDRKYAEDQWMVPALLQLLTRLQAHQEQKSLALLSHLCHRIWGARKKSPQSQKPTVTERNYSRTLRQKC